MAHVPTANGATMNGATSLVKSLEAAGVDVMFGLPGGAILPAYDPIFDSSIRHILVRHEQGAGHAATGGAAHNPAHSLRGRCPRPLAGALRALDGGPAGGRAVTPRGACRPAAMVRRRVRPATGRALRPEPRGALALARVQRCRAGQHLAVLHHPPRRLRRLVGPATDPRVGRAGLGETQVAPSPVATLHCTGNG